MLGVAQKLEVLGNVIPLLVLAVVFSFSCESWMRTAAQMILVFLYFLTFSYALRQQIMTMQWNCNIR